MKLWRIQYKNVQFLEKYEFLARNTICSRSSMFKFSLSLTLKMLIQAVSTKWLEESQGFTTRHNSLVSSDHGLHLSVFCSSEAI